MPKYPNAKVDQVSERATNIENQVREGLHYLGASISLMPYMMYEKLGLGEPKPMRMSLELPDRPFLATAWDMIYVFNKKITLRVGDEEVILDVDQSIKGPPAEDDECYGIDFLDTTIHLKTQELLEDDQLDSFLFNNLEESIDLSDLESCGEADDIGESRISIWCIEEINTSYSQETKRTDETQSEHLYFASANEVDEKRPVLKTFPPT
nr:hypothetical protein [Tanacetum cinerariifolium]